MDVRVAAGELIEAYELGEIALTGPAVAALSSLATSPIQPTVEWITEEELSEFEEAIDVACLLKSSRPPSEAETLVESWRSSVPDYFRSADGALVVSFDQDWEPFLLNTRAYNRYDQRWYIPSGGEVLYSLGEALESVWLEDDIRGGRVFLNSYGACRRPAGTSAPAEWLMVWATPRWSHLLGDATSSGIWSDVLMLNDIEDVP